MKRQELIVCNRRHKADISVAVLQHGRRTTLKDTIIRREIVFARFQCEFLSAHCAPPLLEMASSLLQGVDLSHVPAMQPPPGVQPNFVNPITMAQPVIAISVATSILAITLLSARLYSSRRITRSAGYDDCACIAAMALSLNFMGLVSTKRKYGRHPWDIPVADFAFKLFEILLWESIIGAVALLFAKPSILLLLFRLFFPNPRFRYAVYIGIVWTTLVSLTSVIVAGALCARGKGEASRHLEAAHGNPTQDRCTKYLHDGSNVMFSKPRWMVQQAEKGNCA